MAFQAEAIKFDSGCVLNIDQRRVFACSEHPPPYESRELKPMMDNEIATQDGSPAMFKVNAPMLVTGGTFNQVNHSNATRDPRKVVYKAFKHHIAHSATNDSIDLVDPPRCHPKTRLAILKRLEDWLSSTDTLTNILWLFGPAGAGKSAIARSLAEILAKEGRLGSTFFFLRTADMRSSARFLISTLAYDLTIAVPDLVEPVSLAVESNPTIFQQSLETQMERLIVEPVVSLTSNPSRALIIDGLDECSDRDIQCRIIKLLAKASLRLEGRIKFFVFSRQEYHIETTFKSSAVSETVLTLNLKDDLDTLDDILVFLAERFQEIKETHPLHDILIGSTWPGEDDIDELVRRSSGNFIYPQTVMKYIEAPFERPQHRLQTVLELSATNDHSPYAELDCLYYHILSSSRTDRPSLLRILGTMAVFKGDPENIALACSTVFQEKILSLSPGDIALKLLDLRSLITFESYIPAHPHITFPFFLHTSMFNFLRDRARSKDFYIDMVEAQKHVAIALTRFLEKSVLNVADPKLRKQCNCKSHLLCDHKWSIFYNALSWVCSDQTVDLWDVIQNHDISLVYDVILTESAENNIGILLGAQAVPVLFLNVLEIWTLDGPSTLPDNKHYTDYQQFLKNALDRYYEKDTITEVILALMSSLGPEEFRYAELDIIRRWISILLLYHPASDLPEEERGTLLYEINASPDLRVMFQTVIDTLKPMATGDLRRSLLFIERVIPFDNEYSVARHLARFLLNEDISGRYHCDDESLSRATVYCVDQFYSRFKDFVEHLEYFCRIIGKLLVLQLYRNSPRVHHLPDGRSVYLPKPIQHCNTIMDCLRGFLDLASRFCEIRPLTLIGHTYVYVDLAEFQTFQDIVQAFLAVPFLKQPIEENPNTPCLVPSSIFHPSIYDFSTLTITTLDKVDLE